jgi:magnesium transporter
MSNELSSAVTALNRRFLLDFPRIAASRIEELSRSDAADALAEHDANTLLPVMSQVAPDVATELLARLPDSVVTELLTELLPNDAARLVAVLDDEQRDRRLAALQGPVAQEIRRLLEYPADSAGRLMDSRVLHFRESATVGATLDRLRQARAKAGRSLFVVDEDAKLSGRVSIQDIALAQPGTRLKDLAQPLAAVANSVMPREELVESLKRHKLVDLPVVDLEGRLAGIVYHDALVDAIEEDASVDIQTMVGASKEERALSPALFAVRKRLPWLQINLLTAFLAAFVVGIFEATIAQFTALAVLLPVVAGQSGNAGAQALAVTMRGLALREISLRHWLRVMLKEVQAGFVNGLAIAVTCGLGVYLWSGSTGLVLVIAASMVLAMVAAGFAGALVPIALIRFGQDPAQASSIILTTVTDVAGFFSFLGIATVLAGML